MTDLLESVDGLLCRLEARLRDGTLDGALDEETIQRLLTIATKLYAGTLERTGHFPPFGRRSGSDGLEVTATEVAVAASEMLKALQIELFELGMWQTWGGLARKAG